MAWWMNRKWQNDDNGLKGRQKQKKFGYQHFFLKKQDGRGT
jgi:hypothetical protein